MLESLKWSWGEICQKRKKKTDETEITYGPHCSPYNTLVTGHSRRHGWRKVGPKLRAYSVGLQTNIPFQPFYFAKLFLIRLGVGTQTMIRMLTELCLLRQIII